MAKVKLRYFYVNYLIKLRVDFSFKFFYISILRTFLIHYYCLFLSCSLSSKAERPLSLSLSTGDAMVRGGHGGARTTSTDAWHASDLGRAVYAPGFQVRQIGHLVILQLGEESS